MNITDTLNLTLPASASAFNPPFLPPLWMRVVAGCICIPITVLGGIGNVTILLAFALNRKLLWKKQNVYLFCLTITDLLTSTLSTSATLDQYLLGQWRYGRQLCRAFQISLSLMFIGSFMFVALIARDRMLMVVKGPLYTTYETAARKWLYAAINVISIPILLLPYHSLDIFSGFSIFAPGTLCNPEQLQSLYVTVVNQLIFTMLPGVAMLYYYARVRRYFRKRRKIGVTTVQAIEIGGAFPATNLTNPSAQQLDDNHIVFAAPTATDIAAQEKARRAAKIMNVLLISAFQCCLPSTSMSIVMNTLMANPTLVTFETFIWWSNLYVVAYMWGFTAHALNPFLYAYAMPSFQEATANVGRTLWRLMTFSKNQ